MAKDIEIHELCKEEKEVFLKPDTELTDDEKETVSLLIKKQTEYIQLNFEQVYLYFIANFFSDPHQYYLLRMLNSCLYKYEPASIRDMMQMINDMVDVKWNNMSWRKQQFECIHESIKCISDQKSDRKVQSQIRLFYDRVNVNQTKSESSNVRKENKYSLDDAMRKRIAKEILALDCEYKIISELYDIPINTIQKYVTKEDTLVNIKRDLLEKFANAFHCSVEYLLGETEERMEVRMLIDEDIQTFQFAVSLQNNNYELEKMLIFLLRHYNERFIKNMFIVTNIWDTKDSQTIHDILVGMGKWIDSVSNEQN